MNNLYKNIPGTPGVYIMKDIRGRVLYVGKAGNLKRRVASYFMASHEARIEGLIKEIKNVDYLKTDTAFEALILEAKLIKKYEPLYNIREKDDKSFLFVEITKEKFPRVLLVRGKTKASGERFGPFTSASSVRQALRIIRKIFPWSVHPQEKPKRFKRGCFDYQIGLCPGTCIDAVSRVDYLNNIRNVRLLFKGRKNIILKTQEKEMKNSSKKLDFEKAEKSRRQIFALQHIQDIALITEPDLAMVSKISIERIEGYDISNISGASAVGSMVVFIDNRPAKDEYRKFKIRAVIGADDVGMLKEVLIRRFKKPWPLPNLILVDGGKPQVGAAKSVLEGLGLRIPIVGVAKGSKRNKNEFIGRIPGGIYERVLIQLRDEAHRFALDYHKKLRNAKFKELWSCC